MSKQKREKYQNEKQFSTGSIRPGRVFYFNAEEVVDVSRPHPAHGWGPFDAF